MSRTQFQYTLEDPNADELNTWAPRMLAKLQQLPELRDVASDQQVLGPAGELVVRPRHGVAPRHHAADDRQHAVRRFGQRQVSTMFTQLNQYHVVLEVKPEFQQNPQDLRNLYIRSELGAGHRASEHGVVRAARRRHAGASSVGPRRLPARSRLSSTAVRLAFGGAPPASAPVFPNGGQVPLSAFTHIDRHGAHHGESPGPVSRW